MQARDVTMSPRQRSRKIVSFLASPLLVKSSWLFLASDLAADVSRRKDLVRGCTGKLVVGSVVVEVVVAIGRLDELRLLLLRCTAVVCSVGSVVGHWGWRRRASDRVFVTSDS